LPAALAFTDDTPTKSETSITVINALHNSLSFIFRFLFIDNHTPLPLFFAIYFVNTNSTIIVTTTTGQNVGQK
jgi:hypothetical protein